MQPGVLHRRFLTDLSSSLFSFVLPLLPTNEELTVKEEYVRSPLPLSER
jgi:terminal uridylyltransferase